MRESERFCCARRIADSSFLTLYSRNNVPCLEAVIGRVSKVCLGSVIEAW